MLRFVIGPAASGKTTTIHNLIKNNVDNCKQSILLVPEQNTFETERAMLEVFGGGFMSKVEVLSFTRLCEKAGQIYGGIAGIHIDDSQRNVIMARCLKKLSPHLKVFSKYISSTSFISQMVNIIKEFIHLPLTQPIRNNETIMNVAYSDLTDYDFATTYSIVPNRKIFLLNDDFTFQYDSYERKGSLCKDSKMIDGYIYKIKTDFLIKIINILLF